MSSLTKRTSRGLRLIPGSEAKMSSSIMMLASSWLHSSSGRACRSANGGVVSVGVSGTVEQTTHAAITNRHKKGENAANIHLRRRKAGVTEKKE